MIIINILVFGLLVFGIGYMLKLTPETITKDIISFLSPNYSLREKVKLSKGKKKRISLANTLLHIQEALKATGKGNQFAILCALSIPLSLLGGTLAILIDNYYLIPVFAIILATIPFLYAKNIINDYDKHIETELETALSMITTSYNRNENFILAVSENIANIKPPIVEFFKEFLVETTALNSNIKVALYKLRAKISNSVFREWVDTLIQCQDDRTQKDTLNSILSKLSDVRIVNNELKRILIEPKKEFFMLVSLVILNVPIIYFINKDWYHMLMYSTYGKITLAVCGMVILVTSLIMTKYTKPIKIKL